MVLDTNRCRNEALHLFVHQQIIGITIIDKNCYSCTSYTPIFTLVDDHHSCLLLLKLSWEEKSDERRKENEMVKKGFETRIKSNTSM